MASELNISRDDGLVFSDLRSPRSGFTSFTENDVLHSSTPVMKSFVLVANGLRTVSSTLASFSCFGLDQEDNSAHVSLNVQLLRAVVNID